MGARTGYSEGLSREAQQLMEGSLALRLTHEHADK